MPQFLDTYADPQMTAHSAALSEQNNIELCFTTQTYRSKT